MMQPHRFVPDFIHHLEDTRHRMTSLFEDDHLKTSPPTGAKPSTFQIRSPSLSPQQCSKTSSTYSEEEVSPERDENSNVSKTIDKGKLIRPVHA